LTSRRCVVGELVGRSWYGWTVYHIERGVGRHAVTVEARRPAPNSPERFARREVSFEELAAPNPHARRLQYGELGRFSGVDETGQAVCVAAAQATWHGEQELLLEHVDRFVDYADKPVDYGASVRVDLTPEPDSLLDKIREHLQRKQEHKAARLFLDGCPPNMKVQAEPTRERLTSFPAAVPFDERRCGPLPASLYVCVSADRYVPNSRLGAEGHLAAACAQVLGYREAELRRLQVAELARWKRTHAAWPLCRLGGTINLAWKTRNNPDGARDAIGSWVCSRCDPRQVL
jgi:hypothetical protein